MISTTNAGSGHPTSALSATDLRTALYFGGTIRYKSTVRRDRVASEPRIF
jgi:transketolase N-terminal domain/subunit